MIPRNLPGLAAAAIRNGWGVDIKPRRALLTHDAYFTRGRESVLLEWDVSGDAPVLDRALINGDPTPYAQCARLIRSTTEGVKP